MRRSARIICLLAMFFSGLCPAMVWAASGIPWDSAFQVRDDAVTPHLTWAKPLPGKPLKVLFIGPRYGMREVVEASQRVDLDYAVLMTANDRGHQDRKDFEARFRSLMQQSWDAIVVGTVRWDARIGNDVFWSDRFQDIVLYDILKKVSQGTGLIYSGEELPPVMTNLFTGSDGWDGITSGLPLDRNLGLGHLSRQSVQTMTLKKGHFVFIRQKPGALSLVTRDPSSRLEYEYQQAFFIRCLLWACGREPRFTPAVGLAGGKAAIAGNAFEMDCNPGRDALQTDLVGKLRIIDRAADVRFEKSWKLSEGKTVVVPSLPSGVYIADYLVCDGSGAVLAWTSAGFNVSPSVVVRSLQLDGDTYLPGGTVSVTVKITSVPAGNSLLLEAVDNHQRVWFRQKYALQPGESEARCAVNIPSRPLSLLHTVRVAVLNAGKQPLAEARQEFCVDTGMPDDFLLGGWGQSGGSWLMSQSALARWRMGFGANVFAYRPEANLRGLNMAANVRPSGAKDGSRIPCLTDEAYLESERKRIQDRVKSLKKNLPLGYSLGDEPSYGGICESPSTVKGFQQWLRGQYPDIAALNAVWGTGYTDWSEVRAVQKEKTAGVAAQNFAPWLDAVCHGDYVMAEHASRLQEFIREVQPGAVAGFEGTENATAGKGYDWELLAGKTGMLIQYLGDYHELEAVRSFAPKDMLTGGYTGSYPAFMHDERTIRRLPWLCLAHGFKSVWWFSDYLTVTPGHPDAGVLPDYRPGPALAVSLDETGFMQSGLSKWILSAAREDDGIAVLYSMRNHYLDRQPIEDVVPFLESLGYQYRLLSAGQLEKDAGLLNGVRLLVLPGTVALSDQILQTLRLFVNRGGIVLADVPPGIFDGHGKVRPDFPLHDVFGLSDEPWKGDITRSADVVARLELSGTDSPLVRRVGPAYRLLGAQALGKLSNGSPALTVNRYGEGTALLMNFSFQYLSRNFSRAVRNRLEDVLVRQLSERKIAPPVGLTLEDKAFSWRETVRYTDGESEVLLLLLYPDNWRRPVSTHNKGHISLDKTVHAYLPRNGAYLGQGREFDPDLADGPATVVSLLPYRLQSLDISAPSGTVGAGGSLQLQVSLKADKAIRGRNILHVRVRDSRGCWRRELESNREATAGRAVVDIPIACNDPAGEWLVSVRDALTGMEREYSFKVTASADDI